MSQGAGPQDPIDPPDDAAASERLDSTWWDVEDGGDDAAAGSPVSFPGDDGYEADAGPGRRGAGAATRDASPPVSASAMGASTTDPDRNWRSGADDGPAADADGDRITFAADTDADADGAVRAGAGVGAGTSASAPAAARTAAAPVSRAASATGSSAARAGAGAGGRGTRVAAAAAPRRRWPIVAGVALLGAAVIALVSQTGNSNNNTAATSTKVSAVPTSVVSSASTLATTAVPASTVAPTTGVTTAAPTTVARTTIAPTTVASPPPPTTPVATTAPPTSTPSATTAPRANASSPANPAAVDVLKPVRWALVSQGKVYLRGRVPSQAVAEEIRRKVALAADDQNVFVEYTIDPSAPLPADAPIFVTDTVLFDPDSSVVRPEFQAVLELGRFTMEQNPKVRVTVIGRADSRGDPDYNLQLSRERAQAAVDFMARTGVDRTRFTIVAKGADQPVADQSTDAGMQANRAVEFIAYGFLDN